MTAELAMGLPSLVAVVFLLLWMISAVAAQTRCAEAARLGARAAARGETPADTRTWALRAAPAGAVVEINRDGDGGAGAVQVRVAVAVRAGGAGSLAPAVTVSAVAVAAVEDPPRAGGS
ncbi:TadE family type IV pilus minor pilin [Frankia sp. EI5c]|uniref:TadE family type IV pilus minor pilin n=1 Tax=Frankia sp. EI5c TaxID=683316 RepID=UPI001F5BA99F|nr:TadE family type IV pilus minor pilin [Frankia sp. EI5c]